MLKLPERYKRIEKPNESGGFSKIWPCEDKHLSRKVAIKEIKDLSDNKRVQDEISALLQMRSKHVVQVFDIIRDVDGNSGIVEEFIDGKDLWDSDFPTLSTENYLLTLWQISSGISDIHSAGIIHRDINPGNMKRDSEGIVKIYDFGLSRDDGDDAATKGFKGTLGFAAPELYSDSTIAFTKAVDVYSFGKVAISIACLSLPQELRKQPPLPVPEGFFTTLPIPIPESLAELFQSCVAHEFTDRPQIFKVRDEIARYLLKNKHQALVVIGGKESLLNSNKKDATLKFGTVGEVQISYDGFKFIAARVVGEIFINNLPVENGFELPGSCVIAIGGSHRKNNERAFVTFDVSHPEVVL